MIFQKTRPRLLGALNSSSHSTCLPKTTTTSTTTTPSRNFSSTPTLAARLIRRPKRPYTFTQLVHLSDGSTYTHRTTSPHPLYRSTKDPRNHALWQPSDRSLRNVELDEAGKIALFRSRFGRDFDASSSAVEGEEEEEEGKTAGGSGNKKKTKVKAAQGDQQDGGGSGGDMAKLEAAVEDDKKKNKKNAAKAQDLMDDPFDMGDLISGYAEGIEVPKGGVVAKTRGKDKKK